jgi:hypothetical protein
MKGVAIPYIIAILIGIIVLVIAVFIFYKSSGGAILTSEQCKARFLTWCTNCVMTGWKANPIPTELKDCLPGAGIINPPNDCTDAADKCKLIGVTTTISTTTTLAH